MVPRVPPTAARAPATVAQPVRPRTAPRVPRTGGRRTLLERVALDVAADAALTRCVACSAQAFAEEHWGRAPRLSRAADLPSDFADLFDEAAVDELVSE